MLYNLKQWIYRNIKKYVLRSFPELLIVSDKRLRTSLTLVQNNADESLILGKKTFIYVFTVILAGVLIYQILPRNMQDMVLFLTYERNLEQVTDVLNSSGSLNDALDERTNGFGNQIYDRMSFSQKLIGNEWDRDMILSDYRGFIVSMGLIGFVLVIFISFTSLIGASFQLKVSLFLVMLLIMLHRSWFFYEPFPSFRCKSPQNKEPVVKTLDDRFFSIRKLFYIYHKIML